jgi:hypothetical protein
LEGLGLRGGIIIYVSQELYCENVEWIRLRLNKRAGMSGNGYSSGVCNGWPVSRNQPLDTTQERNQRTTLVKSFTKFVDCLPIEEFLQTYLNAIN